MNHQPIKPTAPSSLSLLVDAASSQGISDRIEGKSASVEPPPPTAGSSLPPQATRLAREIVTDKPQQQVILPHRSVSGLNGVNLFQQHNALAAAQQQQVAALALAADISAAVTSAQLQQAVQIQNHDLLIARAIAVAQQQLGLPGLTCVISKQQLEEFQRRQLLAIAGHAAQLGNSAPSQLTSSVLAAHQQIQGAHMSTNQDSILDRAGLHRAPVVASCSASVAPSSSNSSIQKPPGSVVVPCRARGMPMDHNFKASQMCCHLYVPPFPC